MTNYRQDDVASTQVEINEINQRLRDCNLVIIDATFPYGQYFKSLYQVCHKLDMDDIDRINSRLLHNILEMQRNPSMDQMRHYVDTATLILNDHELTHHGDVVQYWLSLAMLVTSRFILERLREKSDCWTLAGNINGVLYIKPERGISSAHIEP